MPNISVLDHEQFMSEAIKMAIIARDAGDLPIGAVIVCDNNVIAHGKNSINTTSNRLNHAEIDALRNGSNIIFEHPNECSIYTTVEPCVMCLGSIAMADIRHVYFGVPDPRRGGTDMYERVPYIKKEIYTYRGGILEFQCTELAGDLVRR